MRSTRRRRVSNKRGGRKDFVEPFVGCRPPHSPGLTDPRRRMHKTQPLLVPPPRLLFGGSNQRPSAPWSRWSLSAVARRERERPVAGPRCGGRGIRSGGNVMSAPSLALSHHRTRPSMHLYPAQHSPIPEHVSPTSRHRVGRHFPPRQANPRQQSVLASHEARRRTHRRAATCEAGVDSSTSGAGEGNGGETASGGRHEHGPNVPSRRQI